MSDIRTHITNIGDNLQLLADFGCCVTTLITSTTAGLQVKATARPATVTRIAPVRQVGDVLDHEDDREAYECLTTGHTVLGARVRGEGAIRYTSYAYPVQSMGEVYAVIIRDVPIGIAQTFGPLEESFVSIAQSLLKVLRKGPLRDVNSYTPFSTTRVAGDGVLYMGGDRTVLYSSPNISSIMRLVASDDIDRALRASSRYEQGLLSVFVGMGCFADDVIVGDRVLSIRAIPLQPGALVLMEDVTELRAHEREMRVKEATIREVHHRVKNNLQTIESLLRIQMRRTESEEVRAAFTEAVTRIGAMAVVHDMLSYADDEMLDIATLAEATCEQIRYGLVGSAPGIQVCIEGIAGRLDARGATSLSLALAEAVHNAIEHGLAGRDQGEVSVRFTRDADMLTVVVEDDGCGLPEGFSIEATGSMGLLLMRTMVEDDLLGVLTFGRASSGQGALFRMEIPVAGVERMVTL